MSAMEVVEPRVIRQSTSELAREAAAFQEETSGVARVCVSTLTQKAVLRRGVDTGCMLLIHAQYLG